MGQSLPGAAEAARPHSPAQVSCVGTAVGFLLSHSPVSAAITVLKSILDNQVCYQTKPISPKGILKLICVSHSLHHLKGQLLLYPAPWAQAASTCWELQPGKGRKTSSPGRWHWKEGCLSIL